MNLPTLSQPERYRGLYVYDFGDWTAAGYTAEEIAVLLDSEATRGGKVYKIVRATPDGHVELRGVSATRFQLESGLMFYRQDLPAAQADFAELRRLGADGVPCRAMLQLSDRGSAAERTRYVTALVYPAEYDDEVSGWLLEAGFAGGDTIEGGASHVTDYHTDDKTILERCQLWSQSTVPSRSADEVLRSVRQAVQR